MTPLYVTIDGVQKELTTLLGMVDGVQKDMTSLLAAVDSVAREVFSSKPLYVWEKYTYADEFVVDTSEKVSLKLSQISGDDSKITKYNGDVPSSGTSTTFGSAIKVGTYIVAVDGSVYQATQEYSGIVLISGLSCYRVTVKTGKGDYVETVEGETPDMYPLDGLHTDGYWYVYMCLHYWKRYAVAKIAQIVNAPYTENYLFDSTTGTKSALVCATASPPFVINSQKGQPVLDASSSDVEKITFSYDDYSAIEVGSWLSLPNGSYYSNVTVLVSSVSTSLNEGLTYPYWVNVNGSKYVEAMDSMGDYIDTVGSDDESTYPENGVHTDGYWYVKI